MKQKNVTAYSMAGEWKNSTLELWVEKPPVAKEVIE